MENVFNYKSRPCRIRRPCQVDLTPSLSFWNWNKSYSSITKPHVFVQFKQIPSLFPKFNRNSPKLEVIKTYRDPFQFGDPLAQVRPKPYANFQASKSVKTCKISRTSSLRSQKPSRKVTCVKLHYLDELLDEMNLPPGYRQYFSRYLTSILLGIPRLPEFSARWRPYAPELWPFDLPRKEPLVIRDKKAASSSLLLGSIYSPISSDGEFAEISRSFIQQIVQDCDFISVLLFDLLNPNDYSNCTNRTLQIILNRRSLTRTSPIRTSRVVMKPL